MKVIRFGVRPEIGAFDLELPPDAEVLTFRSVGQRLRVFVRVVNPAAKKEARTFYLVDTERDFELREGLEYIGSAEVSGTSWHLFGKLCA